MIFLFIFSFISIFTNRHYIKKRIIINNNCDNLNDLINGSIYQSILDYSKIDNNTYDTYKMIQEYDFYNVTEHALKYGAYTRHLPNNNEDQTKDKKYKKKKGKKKINEQKYINDILNKFNKKNKIDKENKENKDKPLIFMVSPNQLSHYRAYNKTIHKHKNLNNDNDKKNNTKLPDDFQDDEYYIWF